MGRSPSSKTPPAIARRFHKKKSYDRLLSPESMGAPLQSLDFPNRSFRRSVIYPYRFHRAQRVIAPTRAMSATSNATTTC